MSQLRAVLIGVNEYKTPRKTQTADETNMPSAVIDVANMQGLLDRVAPKLGFRGVTAVALTGQVQTTRLKILAALRLLWEGAQRGDQLVLYYSGHSVWMQHTLKGACPPDRSWDEVALCPSDTNWKDDFITSADVYFAAQSALADGACLEVILETCSATGLRVGGLAGSQAKGLERRAFGDNSALPPSFARWDACELDQSSHSGPYPPCEEADLQGLFTRFFCDEFTDSSGAPRARSDLLCQVNTRLGQYRERFYQCCRKFPWDKQTARLSCWDTLESLPALMGNCSGAAKEAERFGKLKWFSPEEIEEIQK